MTRACRPYRCSMDTSASLRALAEKIDRLPLIDSAVHEILALLNRPDSNFSQVVEHLSPDLAVRLLDMANAAHPETEVRSLKHALSLLGFAEMRQMLTTAVMVDHFTGRIDAFRFDRFVRQARFCAVAADMLGRVMEYPHREDLTTAAILHNIGKLVMAVYFPQAHAQIVACKRAEFVTTHEAEIQVLGHGHAEIGALVLRRFNVPEDICEAVRYHNTEDRSPADAANFQLEFTCRKAARMVGGFALPDADSLVRLRREAAGDLEQARRVCQQRTRQALRESGFAAIFPDRLDDAADRVVNLIARFIPRRESFEPETP